MRLSDQIREEMDDGRVTILPTTTAADSGASGGSNDSNVTLTDAVVRTDLGRGPNGRLLPTPEAKLASSGPDYARMNRDGSGGDDLTTTIWRLREASTDTGRVQREPGRITAPR